MPPARPVPDAEDDAAFLYDDEVAPSSPAQDLVEGELSGRVHAPVRTDWGIPDKPEFTRAPRGVDAQTAFDHYDGTISRAHERVASVLDKAERYWRLTAGPALKEIRDGDLYKAAGYATFEVYVNERWDMSRSRAYQLIDAERAMGWLAPITQDVPNERQLRALLPVGDEYGEEAAQRVWQHAVQNGRPSGAKLEEAAVALGYRSTPAPVSKPAVDEAEQAWSRMEPAFRSLGDLSALRMVAKTSPEKARALAVALRAALEELEADLLPG